MANKIMLIMVINLLWRWHWRCLTSSISKRRWISATPVTPPLSGRGESAGQNPVYETDRGVLNNNPVVAFTLEITAKRRQFTLTDHREAVLYVAMSRYQENRIYSVLVGKTRKM